MMPVILQQKQAGLELPIVGGFRPYVPPGRRNSPPLQRQRFGKEPKKNTRSITRSVSPWVHFRSKRKKKRRPNYPKDENPTQRCGACILNRHGTACLLVKQRDGKWGLPKGSWEPDIDSDFEQCMLREVSEETGIDLSKVEYEPVCTVKRHHYFIYVIHMTQELDDKSLKPKDVNEIEEVRWIYWTDLGTYALNYVTKHVLYKHGFVKGMKEDVGRVCQKFNKSLWSNIKALHYYVHEGLNCKQLSHILAPGQITELICQGV
jgi:8-oxo-dGTP pyrophosphatase MutT (NUDIX family)